MVVLEIPYQFDELMETKKTMKMWMMMTMTNNLVCVLVRGLDYNSLTFGELNQLKHQLKTVDDSESVEDCKNGCFVIAVVVAEGMLKTKNECLNC